MGKYVEVTIKKPLYGSFCYIRDTYLNEARRTGKSLKITVPQGTSVMTLDEWMDGAKKMSKVFLQPNNPMILYGNFVRLEKEHGKVLTGSSPEQTDQQRLEF